MNRFLLTTGALFALSTIATIQAQESVQLEGTEIIGNKELPRVLYIVPWKSVERFDIETPAIDSIMDQQLKRIERTAFRRKIHFYNVVFSKVERIDNLSE